MSDDTAKAAYEAFCLARGKTPGKDTPGWARLNPGSKAGWEAAVQAVIRTLWIGGNDGEPEAQE